MEEYISEMEQRQRLLWFEAAFHDHQLALDYARSLAREDGRRRVVKSRDIQWLVYKELTLEYEGADE